MHDALAETPGVMMFLSTAERFGGGALAVLDETLGVLCQAGFDDATAVEAFHALTSFTVGSAGMTAAWRARAGDEDPEERRRQTRLWFEAAPKATHPHVVAAAAALAGVSRRATFEFGLAGLLDAFERRLPGSGPGRAG
jgi:hypothetical protein